MQDASARSVMQVRRCHYAFRQFRPMFEAADVVFGNLEGPLTARGAADGDKPYVFRSPPFAASMALVLVIFHVVSLANNHMLDYGTEGLADTMAALDEAGIAKAGAGRNLNEARKPAIVEADGRRIAFLAYSMTLPETFYATDARAGTAFGHEEKGRLQGG
jgi:poly-gamma-glutamate synthesis protein (capsule biosynthesis protein)